jgi:periplasmic protein TonB
VPAPTASPGPAPAPSRANPGAQAGSTRPLPPCALRDDPALAARTNLQGSTLLRLDIDAKGAVQKAVVLKSAGATREHKLLDGRAQEIFLRCPGMVSATGSAYSQEVSYDWRPSN